MGMSRAKVSRLIVSVPRYVWDESVPSQDSVPQAPEGTPAIKRAASTPFRHPLLQSTSLEQENETVLASMYARPLQPYLVSSNSWQDLVSFIGRSVKGGECICRYSMP